MYVEQPLTLGVVDVAAINQASSTIETVGAAIPNKPVTYQSDFSKVSNTVAVGATAVAAVTAVFVPVGTVIAAVAGIVAVAATVLGKVFKNSAAKKLAAERQEYEKVNADIKFENQQLDEQYASATVAINQLKAEVSALHGVPHEPGLGLCLINCKKNAEQAKLNTAKDQYAVLFREQENKTKLMQDLLDEYNKLVASILVIKQQKANKDILWWILGGSAVLIGGYLLYDNRKKIEKTIDKEF
jgi:hypothetical protein